MCRGPMIEADVPCIKSLSIVVSVYDLDLYMLKHWFNKRLLHCLHLGCGNVSGGIRLGLY